MTVAAVMIVRNSGQFLEQCLDSVKDIVDDIVIVDTGSQEYGFSTDDTQEIARRYTDHFYEGEVEMIVVNGQPHIASYSECRNLSLDKVSCNTDKIFVIDYDEELLDQELFKEAVESDADIVLCRTESETVSGLANHWRICMWRNGVVHYQGRKHNQPVYDPSATTENSLMRIYHYGYNLSKKAMAHKRDVTIALLTLQQQEEPNNPFVVANLIQTYKNQRRWQEIAELVENFDHKTHTAHTGPRIMLDYIFALVCLRRIDEAYMLCLNFLKKHKNDIDALYFLAVVCEKRGETLESIAIFDKFLMALAAAKRDPQPTAWTINAWGAESSAFTNIGMQIIKGLKNGTLSLADTRRKLKI